MYPISSSPFYMGLNKEALEKADALQYVNLEGDRTWTTENFVKMCEGQTQLPHRFLALYTAEDRAAIRVPVLL